MHQRQDEKWRGLRAVAPWALALVASCGDGTIGEPAGVAGLPPTAVAEVSVRDEVVGVSLALAEGWTLARDPALFDTHGFFVLAPEEGGARQLETVARVARAYRATPADLEDLVAAKIDEYRELDPSREEVELADGVHGIAVTGLPGASAYSVVYVANGGHVYEVGLWSADRGLTARARELLRGLRLHGPTQPIESLGLPSAAEALHAAPPAAVALHNEAAHAERLAAVAEADIEEPPPPPGPEGEELPQPMAATCGFTAPTSLYWQLQWDATNTFYSGSWYDLKASPGWSAMSGNSGSWWGTNFHVGRCYNGYANQYYANDWPAQYWANAYAAFSGTVEWAAWGTDGFASLGRYVVVRKGNYRSLTAHLKGIAPGIAWGTSIDAYSRVIGYAGDSGESYANANWAPHLHARVGWNESLTSKGEPYGGQSVRPKRLRCFTCKDYDAKAPSGKGGYYTSFWHGRWMKY
ncbi:MAG: M23 family metallopeptidase [Polyangiaceae bacterium]